MTPLLLVFGLMWSVEAALDGGPYSRDTYFMAAVLMGVTVALIREMRSRR